jgi:hypothetical protein
MSTCKIAIFSGVRIRNRLTRKEQVSGSSLLLSFRSLSLSAEPREETDLDALNVALVRETTQLTDVSLWLRPATSPKDGGGRGYQIDE